MMVKRNSKVLARKVPRKENGTHRNQVGHTQTEENVLETVSHPLIVQIHYALQTPSKLYFGLEMYPCSELFFHLSSASRLSGSRCRSHAPEILLTIEYIHRLNVSYCDLEPENIPFDLVRQAKHRLWTSQGGQQRQLWREVHVCHA